MIVRGLLNLMQLVICTSVLLGTSLFSAGAVYGQQEKTKDPCSELRFMPLLNEAPTLTATDVRTLPQCVSGKFIRLVGIYRVAFENSDLYDPTGFWCKNYLAIQDIAEMEQS